MSVHEESFRDRFCRASTCGALFFVCSHCDRGQRYCSLVCQKQVRRAQWRAASRRHQGSPDGRLDHRDRQRSYRERQAAANIQPNLESVTHRGSQSESVRATVPSSSSSRTLKFTTLRLLNSRSDYRGLICRFCEKPGRFLNPFHVPTLKRSREVIHYGVQNITGHFSRALKAYLSVIGQLEA